MKGSGLFFARKLVSKFAGAEVTRWGTWFASRFPPPHVGGYGQPEGTNLNPASMTIPLVVAFVFSVGTGGCSRNNSGSSAHERTMSSRQFKQFVAQKESQASAAAKADGKEMMPEFKSLFAAASKKDWPKVKSIFEDLARRAPQYSGGGPTDNRLTGTQWAAVLETDGALEAFSLGNERYVAAFGADVIQSIPPGSIYFGGTDQGRFVITAMQKSHVNADPFFTLTQNALADGGYLGYVRKMYGQKIYIPTDEDSERCFKDYTDDATRRLRANQLKPGENVKVVDGKPQVSGRVAVMAINGLIAKEIFDRNPDHEFYIEESFPLDWMYPYLEPHGLIFKVDREPPAELSEAALNEDRDYWTRYLAPLIGDWLTVDTTAQDIAAFVDKVHRQRDFQGFKGDSKFVQDRYSKWMYSKLRSNIAGLYLWRMEHAGSAEEKARMAEAADFALRQAWALGPDLPDVVFRYVNFLAGRKQITEAVLVGETASHFPALQMGSGAQLRDLVRKLKDLQAH
jgi:hypothetical protein